MSYRDGSSDSCMMDPLEGTRGTMGGRSHVLDIVTLLVIFILGWVYTHGIEHCIDIGLYDESNYLQLGISIPGRIPVAEAGPLYGLWYFLLSLMQPDTVDLYFLNYKAMTVLPAIMLFLALRANNVSRILSFLFSLVILFSSANFPTWPKVSHFTVIILLSGFFIFGIISSRIYQTFVLSLTALLASYVRPEFYVGFILLCIVLVCLCMRQLRQTHSIRSVIPLGISLTVALILILLVGIPVSGGDRGMVAFGQHYARNRVIWTNDDRDPWTNWETIVKTDFGDVMPLGKALWSNPSAVARHVCCNLRTFPREFKCMFGSSYPPGAPPARIAFKFGLLALAAAGLILLRKQGIRASADRVIQNGRDFRLSHILIFLLPVVLSIVFIAPRQHYLFILGILASFACAVLLFRKTDRCPEHTGYAILAIVCMAPLMIARPLSDSLNKATQPNLQTIRFLRSFHFDEPINVLEAEGGFGIYVGDNFSRVAEYDKNTSFGRFLSERSINMVILSDRLAKDVRFCDDPEWQTFISDPSGFGFFRLDIPAAEGRRLFIRGDIFTLSEE